MNAIKVSAGTLWASLAVAFGAAAWLGSSVGLLVGLLAAAAGFAIVLLSLRNRDSADRPNLWVAVSLVAVGFASLAIQSALNQPSTQLAARLDYQSHEVTLELLDSPQRLAAKIGSFGSNRFRAPVRLVTLETRQASCEVSGIELACSPRGTVSLSEPDAARLIRGQSLVGDAFLNSVQGPSRDSFAANLGHYRVVGGGDVLAASIARLHESFVSSQRGLSIAANALVAGIAIGDTTNMPADVKADMKATGLTHLTAVSGANCVILAGLLVWALGQTRLRRVQRGLVVLAGIGGYVLLVGQQPSVLRAAVMFSAVTLPKLFGLRFDARDSLASAIALLLIFDPWLAIDWGFALSALATVGLLIAQRPIASWLAKRIDKRAPKSLIEGIAVVLSAQLLCLPLILALSGALPTYTLAANLIAEPLITPITILGMLAVIAAIPFPLFAGALGWLASIPATWILWASHWIANLPLSRLAWPEGWVGIALSISITGACTVVLLRGRLTRGMGIVLAASASIALGFGLAKPMASLGWPMTAWQVVACDVGQGDGLVIRSRGQLAVIDVGRDPGPIDSCLDELGIHRIDLLVLTHFDMDHVGGLRGLTDGRVVNEIIETPWPDERPTADLIRRLATSASSTVRLAESGMSGSLGDFHWQVLSPSRTAVEAEDSNDGSITMEWLSPSLNILTLADLGEKGQMRLVEQHPTLINELATAPLVVKVAHHGSADCYQELYESLRARVAIVSVGKNNGYGHPTERAMHALRLGGSRILRTDDSGAIALAPAGQGIAVSVAGGG